LKKLAIIVLLLIVAGGYYVFSNPVTLVSLADFSGDNQSVFFVFCLERVYSNIDCDNESYLEELKINQSPFAHFIWTRVLSVARNPGFAEFVLERLEDAVLRSSGERNLPDHIKSAGSLGLLSSRDLLFEIAKSKEKFDHLERSLATTALYNIDGVNYGNQFGTEYIAGDKMKRVREAIVSSDGNCRSVDEMLIIDSSYRTTD
jgi:hypothetical protein